MENIAIAVSEIFRIPEELQIFLHEIDIALENGLFYLALLTALTVPDICSALSSVNGETDRHKYMDWYEKWLAEKMLPLTAFDCYKLRCGMVHQGRASHRDMQYDRILFTIPNHQRNVVHRVISNHSGEKILNLDCIIFCKEMISGAKTWFTENKNHQHVRQNLPNLVRYRPNGLAPHIVGMPLIA